MIKLLLGRLLPAGAAIALFTSALSPLRPALNAFAISANALAGDTSAGGQELPGSIEAPSGGGFFSSLFAPRERKDTARRQIEGLVDSLKEKQAQPVVFPKTKKAKGGGKK